MYSSIILTVTGELFGSSCLKEEAPSKFRRSQIWVGSCSLTKKAKKITEIKYDNIESFKNGIAVIILNGRKGIIDQEGKEYFFTRGEKIGSRRSTLYFVKHKDTIIFNTGCFIGDKDAFIKAIKETHGDNNHAYNHLNYIREIEEKLAI